MKPILDSADLANELWEKVYTQVPVDAICRMDKLAKDLEENKIPGDVVECGVWAGGVVIYLAHLFPTRKIWAVDSYEGFQDPMEGNYQYPGEVHTKQFNRTLDGTVWIRYAKTFVQPKDVVLEHLKEYDILVPDHVELLEGYVNVTLVPETCPIKNISLLRVDVDAYSATREVLEFLYDKVEEGGYVVFDDWGVPSADKAISDFFAKKKLPFMKYLELPPAGGSGRVATLKKTKEMCS